MIFGSTEILSPVQLKRLSEHKYSSSGCTLLDPIMQPFWNWLVKKFPPWLAPNVMTIVGLLINIITSLLLIYYSPDGVQEAPRWAFLLCAVGLFAYQTLDACDGKQARRTGTSSPLGELFDHGCDSLSTVLVALGVCVAVQLGTYPSWMFFQCFAAIVLFYSAHWQTYVSGTLRFGKFDVTEAQFTVMLIHIVSAIFGPSVWSIKIPSLYIDIKLIPTFFGLFVATIALYSNFFIIFTGSTGKRGTTVALPALHVELRLLPIIVAFIVTLILCYTYSTVILSGGAGKNGSTVAGTGILSPFVPMGLVVLSAFVIYQKSTENIYENHPCLYILAFGVVSAKVTNRLVVVQMTKSEVDYLDSIFIGPGMLFLNQYFNTVFSEYIVLWICLIYSTADFLYYCFSVCNQICSYLHISLFTITSVAPLSDPDISPGSMDNAPLISTVSNDESSETSVVSLEEP